MWGVYQYILFDENDIQVKNPNIGRVDFLPGKNGGGGKTAKYAYKHIFDIFAILSIVMTNFDPNYLNFTKNRPKFEFFDKIHHF